jgi:AcrR family transcriptional regulator
MPPRVTFSKEDLIRHALGLVRDDGLSSLSARKIAQRMGSSTAPVYQWFDSMDALTEQVLIEIKGRALDYMSVPHTSRHFLNIGMGFALFARDEPGLFKAFHLENTPYRYLVDALFVDLKQDMLNDPRFADMPDQSRAALLSKMWTFTFGLSIQICFGLIEHPTNDFIEHTLSETGTIIIKDALQNMRS